MAERWSTAEQMAIAVLRGDYTSAKALADLLQQEMADGAVPIPLVRKITCSLDKLRVCVFFPADSDVVIDRQGMRDAIGAWLESRRPDQALLLYGATHIELYEMP
jgi:hypothetical protein